MKIIYFLGILLFSHAFTKIPKFSLRKRLYCSNSQDNDENKDDDDDELIVIDLEFNEFTKLMDTTNITFLSGLPKFPETEEEIEEDSFEGFLQKEFYGLLQYENVECNENKLLRFKTFYKWRKNAGIILTKEEIFDIYDTITNNNEYCNLMQFITINRIIDENNEAEY